MPGPHVVHSTLNWFKYQFLSCPTKCLFSEAGKMTQHVREIASLAEDLQFLTPMPNVLQTPVTPAPEDLVPLLTSTGIVLHTQTHN